MWFGLGKGKQVREYGVVVDIGSGSVGIAIVAATKKNRSPDILWTERTFLRERTKVNTEEVQKDMLAAIRDTFRTCGKDGFAALAQEDASARIEHIQVSIAAPWAYTVTNTAKVHRDTPFAVTEGLLAGAIETAKKKAVEEFEAKKKELETDVTLITDATLEARVNGYVVSDPIEKSATDLILARLLGLTYQTLHNAIVDEIERLAPKATYTIQPFMYLYYVALRDLQLDTSEACVLDITNEATEVGIIRDGLLTQVTHTPYGIRTLARELADVCNVPIVEAINYLRGDNLDCGEKSSDVIDLYETNLAELLSRTGDALSIPKMVFLHTDARFEAFFTERAKAASAQINGGGHRIYPVTSRYFAEVESEDTALLLSAYAFHQKLVR